MKFSELGLHPQILQSIETLGYENCTPIQEQTIPLVLKGRDVAGLAQTGTGKTAAFLTPLIHRVLTSIEKSQSTSPAQLDEAQAAEPDTSFNLWRPRSFILVLVPTRELAEQVYENFKNLSSKSHLHGCAIYGGTSYEKQIEALKKGCEFIFATPGRFIDLYKEHLVDLKQCRGIVFDEADRMFDMGFKEDMKYILQRIPRERQFLVFSATLNFDVLNVAYEFGADPVEVNVSKDQTKAENVKDSIYHVGNDEKPQHLLSILKLNNPKQAIIFTNFRHNVDRIARFLNDNQVPAMAISSLLSQAQRNKVMQQFKTNEGQCILVATDVAARGLDIQGVDLVINYELPSDSESYVHRIGRTGRAGNTGTAFSLVSDSDVDSLMRIQDFLKHKLDVGYLEDADLIKDFAPYSRDSFGPPRIDRNNRTARGNFRPNTKDRKAGPSHKHGRRDDMKRHELSRNESSKRDSSPKNLENAKANLAPRTHSAHTKEQKDFSHKRRDHHKNPHSLRKGNEKQHPQRRHESKTYRPNANISKTKSQKPLSFKDKVKGLFKKLFAD